MKIWEIDVVTWVTGEGDVMASLDPDVISRPWAAKLPDPKQTSKNSDNYFLWCLGFNTSELDE